MNPYCLRWLHLQKGNSVEHDVRKTITRVAFRLSRELGIRANPYFPSLDIDCVDIRLHLQHPKTLWSVDIEISVRSASTSRIHLGSKSCYGSLNHWLINARIRKAPCLLFYYDWNCSKLVVLTPSDLNLATSRTGKKSVNIGKIDQNTEEVLFRILSEVGKSQTEAIARQLLY